MGDAGYEERVYAGLLGKLIGVYLGRPVEGWPYDDIRTRFGLVDRFVNDDLGLPLIVADDDISGTLAFGRVVEDRRSGFTARRRRRHLAELHRRGPHDPVVGRVRALHRAHGVPEPQTRHPGTGERFDRAQRQYARGADRGADLLRRVRADDARRS